jgi:hypothetical protein
MQKFFLLLFTVCSITNMALAQLSNRDKTTRDIIFSGSFHYGKSLKHTPKFQPDFPNNTIAAEFNVGVNVNGKQHWHHRYRFPEIGGAFIYMDYGNTEIFGRGMALFPYISFPVVSLPRYKFQIRFGSGLALLSKTYDVINNPTNNVIGARLNSTTQFKFINNIKLSEKWSMLAALSFIHFSNGNVQKPNLGINAVTGNIGLQYHPNDNPRTYEADSAKPYFKRFHAVVKTAIAINEGQVVGGSKFPIYIAMATVAKQTSRFNKVQLGLEYEFRGDRYAALQSSIDRQSAVSRMDVSRFAIVAGNELLFGNFGLSLNAGVYVNKFESKPFILYTKNGIVYYLPIQKNKPSLFMGIFLKSHFAIADYFEYGLGYVF